MFSYSVILSLGTVGILSSLASVAFFSFFFFCISGLLVYYTSELFLLFLPIILIRVRYVLRVLALLLIRTLGRVGVCVVGFSV